MIILRNIPNAMKIIKVTRKFKIWRNKIFEAKKAGDFEKEREYILNAESTWGKDVCRVLGINLHVEGSENIPDKGPVVYISNHQSYSDIPIHCAVLDKIQFGFVAKDDLVKIPIYGAYIEEIRSVLMDRSNAKASMKGILQGISYINDGFSLLIFPEGKRSKGPDMAEFHPGSLKLATKPEVPVVPVTLNGSYNVYENDGRFSGAEIHYVVHKPIETKGMSRTEKAELPKIVEDIVRSGLKG